MVKMQICVVDTDSFIGSIRTDYKNKGTVEGVETTFHFSSYKISKPLHKRKYQKVIGLMKDELGGKIIRICWIKIKSPIATQQMMVVNV